MNDIDTSSEVLAELKTQNDTLRTIRGYLGVITLVAIAGLVILILFAAGTLELSFKLPL